jgi:hypothetical protein
MKKTLLFLLLLLPVLFWLPGCDKDPDPKSPQTEEEKLPPPTQEGKMTFGCLVDGKAWIPKAGIIPPPISVSYNEITGQFGISVRRNLDNGLFQMLSVGNTFSNTGPYQLGFEEGMWADTICSTPTDLNTYRNFNGDIEITQVDFNSGIISGVFKFDAVGDRCADTVKITKGRFDIKYK